MFTVGDKVIFCGVPGTPSDWYTKKGIEINRIYTIIEVLAYGTLPYTINGSKQSWGPNVFQKASKIDELLSEPYVVT
jgi:hypothetical protein